MAWDWSHAPEAYESARENLARLDRWTLEVIYGEWKAHADPTRYEGGFNRTRYEEAREEARTLTDEALVDYIWKRSEEQRTCTNGGWEAWVCPFGCHRAEFSSQGEDEEADEDMWAGYVPHDFDGDF